MKRFHESYAGADHRRAQEQSDGAMMPSGHGSHANMPTEVVFREYPKPHGYMPENLNDGIGGIDHQIGLDNGHKNKHISPKKV